MKKHSPLLIATLLSGAFVASAAVPAAFAQTAPAAPSASASTAIPAPTSTGVDGPRGGHGGFGMLGMSCDVGAATTLETDLDATATRLALTAEQQPLFDAYRTAVLSAQTSFADACTAAQPQAGGTAPDLLTSIKNRQAIESAQLDALNATLPNLEALYNSLTDAQKAQFAPFGAGDHHGRGFGGDRGGQDRGSHNGQGDNGQHDRGNDGGRNGQGDNSQHGRGNDGGRNGRFGNVQPPAAPAGNAPASATSAPAASIAV